MTSSTDPEQFNPDEPEAPIADIGAVEPEPEELASVADDAAVTPADATGEPATEEDEPEPDVGALGTVDQLPAEDTLEGSGRRDLLDETIAPPDAPGPLAEETVADAATGETLSERAEAEQPEVWEDGEPPTT